MTKLSIEVISHPACAVISVSGDLDKVSAPQLEKVISEVLGAGHVHLIVDVSALGFCDSTGVWLLLAGLRRSFEAGGWLRLAGVRGFLQRLLELTRLSEAFPTDPTVAEAMRHVPARRSGQASPPAPA
ncbi:STAS domain-containing protein [Planomonospora sp. ID91781]|uniref:Anti-sigma factor antagonist n=1 Tax=Planomonospora sphaerica TaxID=161355 RepID=A0A171C8S1_9ACTN|nr:MULTISPECIES: STAS domain-containing protein [Planomonospora]MBG0820546.1 STAS domain-containing protein [Planomonospora sp. ID91781]GAT66294.1 anti-sigma-factor antagonist [Planomonospora sphaerica]